MHINIITHILYHHRNIIVNFYYIKQHFQQRTFFHFKPTFSYLDNTEKSLFFSQNTGLQRNMLHEKCHLTMNSHLYLYEPFCSLYPEQTITKACYNNKKK